MSRCKPNGSKYVDSTYGYVFIKVGGKWVREHVHKWKKLRGPIPPGHIVHHKDENKRNNRIRNLECVPRAAHAQIHHVGAKRSEATRFRQSTKARERNARPEYNAMLRERAVKQHAEGRFGRR